MTAPLFWLLSNQLLHPSKRARFGQCLTRRVFLWVKFLGLWDFQEIGTQGVEHHQRKGEVFVLTVDSVDERLFRPGDAIPRKHFRKVGIVNPPFFAQFFNQLFGPSLIKITHVSRFGHKWILGYES